MIDSKLDSEESKFLCDSHTIRLNVIINFFIEKDILINGEVKTNDEIEDNKENRKNKEKNKLTNENGNTSSDNSDKEIKSNNKKKKAKNKFENDSSYYFSYTIAGTIEGESDVVHYSNSTFQTFHDIEINLDFLKKLYNKQVEIKIWKLMPNNEEKILSNEYIYRQIKAKKNMDINARKNSNCCQLNLKSKNKNLNDVNYNKNQQNKEVKNNKLFNNETDDKSLSNQSSVINYDFSIIPIKPVYESLQKLNLKLRKSFQIPNKIKYRFKQHDSKKSKNENNKVLKEYQQQNSSYTLNNNNHGYNDSYSRNNINILPGDYIDKIDYTIHIRPHPHHYSIPEKTVKALTSYSRSTSPERSRINYSRSKNENTHIQTNKKKKDSNENNENKNNNDVVKQHEGKIKNINNKIYKNNKKNDKNNFTEKDSKPDKSKSTDNSNTDKNNKASKKDTKKNKSQMNSKSKNDNFSKRKEEDKYELIGKTTLDITKLFFDENEAEKILDYSVGEIKQFGFKLSLSEPLLSSKQKDFLNPIAIEIISAKSMPPKPSTNKINYAMVAPTYCKFSFLDTDKEYKCNEEHRQDNNKVIFNSVHMLLSGHIKDEELFNNLLYKKLNIEIHDRDYEVPKEKKYISEKFDYIESFRTTYIPNIIYGVASYSLAPLLTGIKELTLTSPVETNFHIKEKGTNFVDNVNYIEYGTSLKIKITVAHPIVKNIISNLNEITIFDFSRIIIIADKSENHNISNLIRIINELNIKEFLKYELEQKKKDEINNNPKSKILIDKNDLKLNKNDDKEWNNNDISISNSIMNSDNINIDSINDINKSDNDNSMDFIENYDIEGYQIDKELLNDSELGIITGFHIFDHDHHMIFLEGPKKFIQHIKDKLNSNKYLKFKTFYSPKLTFYKRIWSSFYISPIYIYLKDSIKTLLTLNSTYLKCHTPKIALETLKLLKMIDECNSMEEINSKVLFPSYEQLNSLIGTLGNNITVYEILLQLNEYQEQNISSYSTINSEEESVVLYQNKRNNKNYKKIDDINYLYMDLTKKRINREPNFIKQNINKFQNLPIPYPERERVYGNEGIPYIYSIQYLNSSELRKKTLQDEYSKYIKVLIHSYNKKYNSQNFEIYN